MGKRSRAVFHLVWHCPIREERGHARSPATPAQVSMTFAGVYPVGPLPKDVAREGRPGASWRSSDIEATFTMPGSMICPVHGGGHSSSRRATPPPPPPAEIRRSCHERSKAKWENPYSTSGTCPDDCHCSPSDRAFPAGCRWAEPGKGWTRNPRHPTSHRLPPGSHERRRKSTLMGIGDNSRKICHRSSVLDTQWAKSYLSTESDAPPTRNLLHRTAFENAERHECQQGPTMAPPGSNCSAGSRRRDAGHLAEAQAIKHVGFSLTDTDKRCMCAVHHGGN